MLKKIKKKNLDILAGAEKVILSWRKRQFLKSDMIPWTTGYAEYKYDFIGEVIKENDLSLFRGEKLPARYGYRLDERAVEYPWFFSRLKEGERVLLDAGSVLNHRQVLAADKLKGRNLHIFTLFDEGRAESELTPSYIYGDLRDTCYRDRFFDAICCLSTLEHVGLDNTKLYTPDQAMKQDDRYGYLAAVKEFSRILKPGGNLYLSLPYGIYRNHGWFQVFDQSMINDLVGVFEPSAVEKTFFRYQDDQWDFSNQEACNDGYCFDIHESSNYPSDFLAFSRCVLCMRLTK